MPQWYMNTPGSSALKRNVNDLPGMTSMNALFGAIRAAWKSIEWGIAPSFVSVISTVCPCRACTTGPGAPPSKPQAAYLIAGCDLDRDVLQHHVHLDDVARRQRRQRSGVRRVRLGEIGGVLGCGAGEALALDGARCRAGAHVHAGHRVVARSGGRRRVDRFQRAIRRDKRCHAQQHPRREHPSPRSGTLITCSFCIVDFHRQGREAGAEGHPGFYAARVRGNTDRSSNRLGDSPRSRPRATGGFETSRNSCCSGSMRGSRFGEVVPTRAEVVCTSAPRQPRRSS